MLGFSSISPPSPVEFGRYPQGGCMWSGGSPSASGPLGGKAGTFSPPLGKPLMWPVAGAGSLVRSKSTRGLYRAAIKVGRKRQLSGWGEKNGTVHTNATITNTAEKKNR